MTRIVATGDLHLGAHPEYGRHPGDRLQAQQQVWRNIVSIAESRDADLLLFAGDGFDGPGIPPEQLAAFAVGIRDANEHGIPIIAITGNGRHDAAMRDVNGLEIFNDVPGITVHSKPGIVATDSVLVATLPWVHPGRLVAKHGGGDRDEINAEAAARLLDVARGLKSACDDAPRLRPKILMLHGSVSGAETPDGQLTDLFREPVIDAYALVELGFDAIVCGHIHKPQDLRYDIPFFYVGSPMPLDFGEGDCRHGVTVLELDGAGPGKSVVEIDFVEVESPPFVTIELDVTEIPDGVLDDAGFDASARGDIDGAVVRMRYRATREQQRRLDVAAIRRALLDAGAHVVKIVPEIVREDRARVDGVDETLAPLQALDAYLDANEIDADLADRMRARTARLLETVAA